MVTLASATNLALGTLSLFVFLISTSFSGAFQALIAKLCGDSTAEEYGYMTLNPLAHVSVVGLILFVLFRFLIGEPIPVDTDELQPPFRYLKFLVVFISRPITNLILGIAALFMGIICFGRPFLLAAQLSLMLRLDINFIHSLHRVLGPESTSLTLMIVLLLALAIIANILLAFFNFIVESIRLLLALRIGALTPGQELGVMLVFPVLIAYFFGDYLSALIARFILEVGSTLGQLVGVL